MEKEKEQSIWDKVFGPIEKVRTSIKGVCNRKEFNKRKGESVKRGLP